MPSNFSDKIFVYDEVGVHCWRVGRGGGEGGAEELGRINIGSKVVDDYFGLGWW